MIGTKQQLAKVNIDHILIGDRDCEISPKAAGKNSGTGLIDSTLSLNSHINKCSKAFYYLLNIRRIRKYLSRGSTEMLIYAFRFLVALTIVTV